MLRRILSSILFMTAVCGSAAAAPENDPYSSPVVLPGDFGVFATIDGATKDPELAGIPSLANSPAVWFRYVVQKDGILVVDTAGSRDPSRVILRMFTHGASGPNAVADSTTWNLGSMALQQPVEVASHIVNKGQDIRIAVLPRSGADSPGLDDFRLNLSVRPVPPASRNYLVLSPKPSYVARIIPAGSDGKWSVGLPAFLSFSPTVTTVPEFTSTFPAGFAQFETLRPDDTTLEPFTGITGQALLDAKKIGSTAAGTFAGTFGARIRSGSTVVGSGSIRVLVTQITEDRANSVRPLVTLSRRSDVGRVGTRRPVDMVVQNTTGRTLRGCYPILGVGYAAGTYQYNTDFGTDGTFRAFSAAGTALAPTATPVNIANNTTVRFRLDLALNALGFSSQSASLICGSPFIYSLPLTGAEVFGSTVIGSYGYVSTKADAIVEPVGTALDRVIVPIKGTKTVRFTVRNTGSSTRTLVVRPTRRAIGGPIDSGAMRTADARLLPARLRICTATTAGTCTSSLATSLSVRFAAGQTKTFKLEIVTTGSLVDFGDAVFLYAQDGADPVGFAGLRVIN